MKLTFKQYLDSLPKSKVKKVRRFAAKRRLDNPNTKFTDTEPTPLAPIDKNRGIRGDAAV